MKKMKKVKLMMLVMIIGLMYSCKKEEEVVAPGEPSIIGVWTPTSAAVNYNATMGQMVLIDTSYTTTPSDPEWDFTDIEFTASGQMIMDGDTMQYTYSGNVLTVTEDGDTETHPCTVTSTDMIVILKDTEVDNGVTITSDITINHIRQ